MADDEREADLDFPSEDPLAEPEFGQPEGAQMEFDQPEGAPQEFEQPEFPQPEGEQPEFAQQDGEQPEFAQPQVAETPAARGIVKEKGPSGFTMYLAMLVIAFLAISTACVVLGLELQRYGLEIKPEKPLF